MDTEAQRRSELVRQVGTQLAEFIRSGALELPEELFAYNFWQDNLPDNFRREASKRLAELGDNAVTNSIFCTSGYQGEIVFSGSSGSARVEFLLAPHLPARVQSLEWLR
jgi:hypothetical protein